MSEASYLTVPPESHMGGIQMPIISALFGTAGSYVVAYQTGKTLYISGHIPMTPDGVLLTGTVRTKTT